MKYFNDIQFKGTFREYQQRVLDNSNKHLKDGKIHIVAAPGSGKTILGCELIRRLGNACLIFSPTVTIRNQWGERFNEWFLNSDEEYQSLVSFDLFDIKLINSITYQALYSAMNKIRVEDDDEICDYSQIDLFKLIKEKGIKTICLDEAHHLKNDWQKALELFMDGLEKNSVKIISLTATPPYGALDSEWQRYIDVCGEIDEEIFVPELVKKNTLCPHQDFVYFSFLNNVEQEKINQHRNRANLAIQEILSLKLWLNLYSDLSGYYTRAYYKVYMKPTDLLSVLLMCREAGANVSKRVTKTLTTKNNLPEFGNIHAGIAITFLLNSKLIKETEKNQIITILKKHGVYENGGACFEINEKLKKVILESTSKHESIAAIVESETICLKNRLRMLILTDYIRKADVQKIASNNDFDCLSIVSIFEHLRRENRNYKLGVLSGSLVILPASLEDVIRSELGLSSKNCKFRTITNTEYCEVIFNGGNKDKVKYVSALFEKGHINVLIGTKSLLGEGWDSPCINSLVLASFVGSFVLSNQMRGRAIRSYSLDPEKCSNIWHLVALDLNSKSKLEHADDFEGVSRRFESFIGPNYKTGEIESGIDRVCNVDMSCNLENVNAYNAETLKRSSLREKNRELWKYGTKDSTCVNIETKVPVTSALHSFNFVGIFSIIMILFIEIFAGIFVSSCVGDLYYRMIVIYFALTCVCVVWLINTIIKTAAHMTNKKSIKTFATCILKALQDEKEIGANSKVVVHKNKGEQYVGVAVKNTTIHEQNVFHTCLTEFFGRIDKPRYVLVYNNMFNMRSYKRSFTCPKMLGDNKKTVSRILKYLRLKGTKFEAIYVKNKSNMIFLQRCISESRVMTSDLCIGKKQKLL